MSTVDVNGVSYTISDIVNHFRASQMDLTLADAAAADIKRTLRSVKTTFAHIDRVTRVATARAFSDRTILKFTSENVLISTLKGTYTRAVRKSAAKIKTNDLDTAKNFSAQSAPFERHADCAAIASSARTGALQLVFIKFKDVRDYPTIIYIDADNLSVMDPDDVADLLTPSARAQFELPSSRVHNAENDIDHTVQVKAVNLFNVLGVTLNGTRIDNI